MLFLEETFFKNWENNKTARAVVIVLILFITKNKW